MLYRDETNSPETLIALEREMDEAQNHFQFDEFEEFKETLPGYTMYWLATKAQAEERLAATFGASGLFLDEAAVQSACTCQPRYLGRCNEDGCDGCALCVRGWVEVAESEYLVDRNTERKFTIIHKQGCKIQEGYKGGSQGT